MARTRHLGLGVIESRWFNQRHHTVRPLFEFLSYALKDRPDAFTYERFVGAESFRESVRFMMAAGEVEYLYVASHGNFSKIETPNGSELSRTALRNMICDINRNRRRLRGVLFGCCKFGDAYNLIEIMRPSKIRGQTAANRLTWAGGYGREIDYTQTSLFDVSFYDLFLRTTGPDELTRLEATVERLDRTFPGLFENLSLSIVVKLPNGKYRDVTAQETVTV